MGGYFEVVLFTDEPSSYAEPIINKLDPYRCAAILLVCSIKAANDPSPLLLFKGLAGEILLASLHYEINNVIKRNSLPLCLPVFTPLFFCLFGMHSLLSLCATPVRCEHTS